METKRLYLDRISNLPQHLKENILSLMPIRDAFRTSVLSKEWRYCWRGMPKLTFINDLVEIRDVDCSSYQPSWKYKFVNAIFHVLFLHNGPEVVEFKYGVGSLQLGSELDLLVNYLSRGSSVKDLLLNINISYKLPVSFFSCEQLEIIRLVNCDFETPLTFKGFERLKCLKFICVKVSLITLQRFFSNCPLLEKIYLWGRVPDSDFAEGNKITLVDLFQCLPLIQVFRIRLKCFCAGGMPPHKLPTPLVHLRELYLFARMMEQNEVSFAFCLLKSSPVLKKLRFWMINDPELSAQQTSINFLDPKDYSDLTLSRLEILELRTFNKSHLVIEFVKLVMAKSHVLKIVKIEFHNYSSEEELKMRRDLVLLPFSQASPSAKLIIERWQ